MATRKQPKSLSKKALKDKWVKALRSGKYKQGTGKLYNERNTSYSKAGYCCLGVAGAVCFGQTKKELRDQGILSKDFAAKLGLTFKIQNELAKLNDGGDERNSVPFEMIAGLIDHAL